MISNPLNDYVGDLSQLGIFFNTFVVIAGITVFSRWLHYTRRAVSMDTHQRRRKLMTGSREYLL